MRTIKNGVEIKQISNISYLLFKYCYDCIRILFTLDDIKYPFPSFVYSRLFSFRIVRNVELKVKSSFEILQ